MNVREELCAAFCAGLQIHEVPAGLAVGTPFDRGDGDKVGFFLVRGAENLWRVEDDGMTIAMLVASGVDITAGERAIELQRMLIAAGASYDSENGELHTGWLEDGEIPAAALKFTALMARILELKMLHPMKIANTFREDVMAALYSRFNGRAVINEDVGVLPEIHEFLADAVLSAPGVDPLAIFIATSDARVSEAVAARALARYRYGRKVQVATVIDGERSKYISLKAQQRARNHLDAAPSFIGGEEASMVRLEEVWLGEATHALQ